jgi:hypothetical protein
LLNDANYRISLKLNQPIEIPELHPIVERT